jgi:hypothetical protein
MLEIPENRLVIYPKSLLDLEVDWDMTAVVVGMANRRSVRGKQILDEGPR